MTREDACYFKILLSAGLSDGYDEWLDHYLNIEDPLSDMVLNLALCGSDVNKTISCLYVFCAEQAFDEKLVCEKLRLFLKDAYYTGHFSKEEVLSYMYRFAAAQGDPGDFEIAVWDSMYYMDYYQSLVGEGLILQERFDSAFFSFLNDGTPLDSDKLWNYTDAKINSLFSRLFNFLRKNKNLQR